MDSKGIFGIQDLTKKYSAGFGKKQAILTEKKGFYSYPGSGIGQNLSMRRARDYYPVC